MKKSFLLYLIMSVFLIGYCACDNDEENFDTATTGQVIKVPDDIKSFADLKKVAEDITNRTSELGFSAFTSG